MFYAIVQAARFLITISKYYKLITQERPVSKFCEIFFYEQLSFQVMLIANCPIFFCIILQSECPITKLIYIKNTIFCTSYNNLFEPSYSFVSQSSYPSLQLCSYHVNDTMLALLCLIPHVSSVGSQTLASCGSAKHVNSFPLLTCSALPQVHLVVQMCHYYSMIKSKVCFGP